MTAITMDIVEAMKPGELGGEHKKRRKRREENERPCFVSFLLFFDERARFVVYCLFAFTRSFSFSFLDTQVP